MSKRATRRTQSVVPFGVGAIVEFEDDALMAAGLEMWPPEAEKIRDERLSDRIGVDHFRVPPRRPDKTGVPGTMAPLPYVRFPQWHFCPRCRWLKKADLFAMRPPQCDNVDASPQLKGKAPCGSLPEWRRRRMLPLRFIAVCEAGHVEDFPWNAWVHTPKGQALDRDRGCRPETLYFYPTKIGGLSGLLVSCTTCVRHRSMMGSTSTGGLKGLQCSGHRPWLGADADEPCNAPPRRDGGAQMLALQRGASNLYFPDVTSSILIPPFSTRVFAILREPRTRDVLESFRVDHRKTDEALRMLAALRGFDFDTLKTAYEALQGDMEAPSATGDDETAYRYAEYRALHQRRSERGDELICKPQEISGYGDTVRKFFRQVTLVERLAETRVLTGFSRISPSTGLAAPLSRGRVNWRPAFRVRGEGVFLALKPDRLEHLRQLGRERIRRLAARIGPYGPRPPLPVSVDLVFLHTLAHLLIKRFSFEAGYGASSIRERIYAAQGDAEMGGILLYTAAGDADGTLGGLVGLGRPGELERLVAGALEEARWCASDPICAESSGQGPGSLNLAACHACSLLPETSCEFQNRFLDREVVNQFFSLE